MAVAGDTGDRRKGISPLDSIREYRELDAGACSPSFETWDRICKLYGWPQTFAGRYPDVGVTRILVTGMSGTGKSSVLAELARRGHRVVDTDEEGWSEEVSLPDESGREQLWVEDRMEALLAEKVEGLLFVAGCTSNQSKFSDRFDAVVLLTAPTDVLLERIATRSTNPFGKDPVERARILEDIATAEPQLRRIATVEISTDAPLQGVVDKVEALAG
jgi:shikimate kinase